MCSSESPQDRLGATLLDLYVIAHAVEGLAPGTYHYGRGEGSLELLREGSFRPAAGRLGPMQELPADAAVCSSSPSATLPGRFYGYGLDCRYPSAPPRLMRSRRERT